MVHECVQLKQRRQHSPNSAYCCIASATNTSRKYTDVMAKLDGLFKVRRNVIFERVKFNRHDQREGQSAKEYINKLSALIETSNFKELLKYL